ncbi:MAG: Ig-like domain-containing protein, partial [bacterium]
VPPYVKKVKVTQGAGNVIYERYWEDDDNNPYPNLNPTRTLKPPNPPEKAANGNTDITIEVEYSEEMTDGGNKLLELYVGSVKVPIRRDSTHRKAFGTLTAQMISNNNMNGEQVLRLIGYHKYAQDWQLDSDPHTFCYQNHNASNLKGYDPGPDQNHRFTIDISKQTIYAIDSGTYHEGDVFYTCNDVNPVVYVRGSGYMANRSYTLYITENLGWEDGDVIDHIKRTVTVSTNAQGEIYPQQIHPGAPQDEYDVILDYDGDGKYTEGLDAIDGPAGPSSPYGAGFRVVPGKRIRVPLLVYEGGYSFKPPAGTWALVTIKRPGFPREEPLYSNLVVNEDGEIQFDGQVGDKILYRVFLKTFTWINPQSGIGDAKAGVLTEPTSPAFYVMASPLFGIKQSGCFYVPDADVVTFVDGWSETLLDEQFRLPALFSLLTIPVNSMLEGNLGYFIYGTMQEVTIINRAAPFRLLDNLATSYDVAREQLPDEEISPAIAIWASRNDYTPDGVSCYWQKTPGSDNYKLLIAPQDANNQDKVFQAYADMLFVRHGKRPSRPPQAPAIMLTSMDESSLAQYLMEQESPGGMIRLNPSPEKRTSPAQAFLNGFCYYFSAVVRESPVVNVGRKAYNLETLTAQGIDNELAVAAMLWAIGSPTTVLKAIYQPRQEIPEALVYNVCDLFTELEAQGMDLTGLYIRYGLRPEIIEVMDQDTTRPTFIWSDNGILAHPDTYTLEIATDPEFTDIVDTFPGLRETTYSLTTTELDNGLYYWRVRVENPNLPDLYSDFGVFEIISTSSGRDHFHVEGIRDPVEVNEESGVTVYVHDARHNLKTDYVGRIHFSSSDTLAGLPADYTFTLADAGSHTFTGGVVFGTQGEQEVQVNDVSDPGMIGSQKRITVIPENFAPVVTITSPTAGAVWSETETIQWQATDANEADTILIGISYTLDGGIHWEELTTEEENDGSYVLDTTLLPDGSYQIKITASDGRKVGEAVSGIFTIDNLHSPSVTLISPNGGEVSGNWTIQWSAEDADNDPLTVDLFYSNNRGTTWNKIASRLPNTGAHNWDTTQRANSNNYLVKVVVSDDGGLRAEDRSDDFFAVRNPGAPEITLLSPNGGESWSGTQAITWVTTGPVTAIDLYWSLNAGATWTLMVAGEPNDGSYSLNTNNYADSNDYLIKVIAGWGSYQGEDISDNPFRIDNVNFSPTVTLLDPKDVNPIEDLWQGTGIIKWSASDPDPQDVLTVDIYYWYKNKWYEIVTGYPNTGHYAWDTRLVRDYYYAYDAYKIKVVVSDGRLSANDSSVGTFSVDNGCPAGNIEVISPNGNETLSGKIDIIYKTELDFNGRLYYSPDAGLTTWQYIGLDGNDSYPHASRYTWDTTLVPNGTNYLIKAEFSIPFGDTYTDISDHVFTINNPIVDYFQLDGLPDTVTVGVPCRLQVTAKDSQGRTRTDYRGTIDFASSDPQAILPDEYSFTLEDQGGHSFEVTFRTVGQQRLRVDDLSAGVGSEIPLINVISERPSRIVKVAGDNQKAPPDTTLAPFVIMVTDDYANPFSNIKVNFEITEYPSGATGQSLSATTGITDDQGRASTTLTLGDTPGTYSVEVTGTGLAPATFTVTAIGANTPPTITIIEPPAGGATADTEYVIYWQDADPDDNALVSLYYDLDDTGYNGVEIVS